MSAFRRNDDFFVRPHHITLIVPSASSTPAKMKSGSNLVAAQLKQHGALPVVNQAPMQSVGSASEKAKSLAACRCATISGSVMSV